MFSYTADKEIRTDDLCLDVSRLNGPVLMLKCHHMKGNQMFEYDAEVGRVLDVPNNSQQRGLQAAGALVMPANCLLRLYLLYMTSLRLHAVFESRCSVDGSGMPACATRWRSTPVCYREAYRLCPVCFASYVVLFFHSLLENGNMIFR